MTGTEIRQLLLSEGFKNAQTFVSDSNYARPTSTYLLGKFYSFYKEWLAEHNLLVWKDRWDCDNFASTYYVFCQMCHFKSKRPEQGIAVGELFFLQDSGGGHAVNCAVTEKGLVIIEPQTGEILRLSETEKKNTFMIRF